MNISLFSLTPRITENGSLIPLISQTPKISESYSLILVTPKLQRVLAEKYFHNKDKRTYRYNSRCMCISNGC